MIKIHDDTKTGFREVPLFREIREIFVRLSGKPDDLIFDREFFNCPCWRRLLNAVNRSGVECWP
ncbi:MAG: hypothetical protein LBN39_06800, partial [Planctomycetaceae bacterium]|nr:hypothetical protein [Planctomycetaceae bacterium]